MSSSRGKSSSSVAIEAFIKNGGRANSLRDCNSGITDGYWKTSAPITSEEQSRMESRAMSLLSTSEQAEVRQQRFDRDVAEMNRQYDEEQIRKANKHRR